jgi:hypothetical protein
MARPFGGGRGAAICDMGLRTLAKSLAHSTRGVGVARVARASEIGSIGACLPSAELFPQEGSVVCSVEYGADGAKEP